MCCVLAIRGKCSIYCKKKGSYNIVIQCDHICIKKGNRRSLYAHNCIEKFWKEMQKKKKNQTEQQQKPANGDGLWNLTLNFRE